MPPNRVNFCLDLSYFSIIDISMYIYMKLCLMFAPELKLYSLEAKQFSMQVIWMFSHVKFAGNRKYTLLRVAYMWHFILISIVFVYKCWVKWIQLYRCVNVWKFVAWHTVSMHFMPINQALFQNVYNLHCKFFFVFSQEFNIVATIGIL